MADEQATFAINLEDGTSGSAASASAALQQLRETIDSDLKSLRAMQAAMKNLEGGTAANVAQVNELRGRIAAQKNTIAEAQSAYIGLGGTFTRNARAGSRTTAVIDGLKAKVEALKNASSDAARATTNTGARFESLKKIAAGASPQLGALAGRMQMFAAGAAAVPLALVAAVASIALLVIGTVTAIATLTRYGLAQGDARRADLLRLEGLALLRRGEQAASAAAASTLGAIDRVSAASALGRDKVASYGEQLLRAGLRGAALEAALEGVAVKAAVQGDASARAFMQTAIGADRAGRSVQALSDKVKRELGGVAAAQMLSLSVQGKKLRESFAALFSGLKVETFLKRLHGVTELFSQSTASGRALKTLLGSAFQPFIDGAGGALGFVRRFIQGAIIGALQIGIAFHKVRIAIKKALGIESFSVFTGFLDGAVAKVALWAGQATVIVGVLAAGVALLALPFVLTAAAIGSVIFEAYRLFRLWKAVDWTGLGRSIVEGIRNGITSGVQWVRDAAVTLATKVKGAFAEALGIQSPSKVFKALGLAIPAGVRVGVDAGTPAARRSVARLVDPVETMPRIPAQSVEVAARPQRTPEAPLGREAQRRAAQQAGGRGAGSSVHIENLNVHTTSTEPRELAIDIRRELARALEGIAAQYINPDPEPVA